ncbi:hypothetical protein K4A83_07135 [Spirulina subsalsa FACHB-351]|uniref:Uncharacterized protein n=1 Tax=Spirulina subsalsa FACHB-351 TaxID=234711 RepID=A0ABT3L3G4_9CYAN|nr:hypothetical protein [Spirulina subsalsa]MCW6036046.1 hypothetical protein [Spirulina subsalsa FACHB-351]
MRKIQAFLTILCTLLLVWGTTACGGSVEAIAPQAPTSIPSELGIDAVLDNATPAEVTSPVQALSEEVAPSDELEATEQPTLEETLEEVAPSDELEAAEQPTLEETLEEVAPSDELEAAEQPILEETLSPEVESPEPSTPEE